MKQKKKEMILTFIPTTITKFSGINPACECFDIQSMSSQSERLSNAIHCLVNTN